MNEERLLDRGLESMALQATEAVREPLLRFLQEMSRWNRRLNLTAITDPREAIEKHLIDSLSLVPLLRGDESLLDVGSGAGLPGIPLKIFLSDLRVLSLDAVGKKVHFQRHIIRLLGLKGFEVRQGRVEAFAEEGEFAGAFEVVVSRAFSSLGSFARLALPFLSSEGRIVAMKGASGLEELDAAAAELDALGLHCRETRCLQLPDSGAKRVLIVLTRLQKDPSNP